MWIPTFPAVISGIPHIDYLSMIKRKCFGKWFLKKGLISSFSCILRVISHRSTRTIVLSAKWISAQNKPCLIIWRKNNTFLFLMRNLRGISHSEFFVLQSSRVLFNTDYITAGARAFDFSYPRRPSGSYSGRNEEIACLSRFCPWFLRPFPTNCPWVSEDGFSYEGLF